MRCRPTPETILLVHQPTMCAPTISRQTIPACWAIRERASSLHWVPRTSAITAEMRQMPVRHLIATTPPIRLWWWNMPLRSSLRISGLQLVSRADCLSRKTVWPITSTTPTIRIYMRSWIIPSANGASWWATDSAPSISVRSRLLQKRTGSTVPTTIATR